MSDIRFINKNGTSVDITTVRKRFFECALDAGVGPERTCTIWNDAVLALQGLIGRRQLKVRARR